MSNIKRILLLSFFFLLIFLIVILVSGDKFLSQPESEADKLLEENREVVDFSNWVLSENLREIDENDTVISPKNSKLDIIIYEDLSDLYSVQFNETLDLIRDNFSDKVRIAFRPFVNKAFPLSEPTYLLAECAKEQGKFFEMRELILSEVSSDTLDVENFLFYGEILDLDKDVLSVCLLDKKYQDKIDAYSREAENFGVYGSPTIFVGSEIVVGARSFENAINGGGENLVGMKNIIMRNLSLIDDDFSNNIDSEDSINNDVELGDDDLGLNNDNIDDLIIACTMDAKICPDGSFVGRDGANNCEFFPCPGE